MTPVQLDLITDEEWERLVTPPTAGLERGDTVRWFNNGMMGTIVDLKDGEVQVAWEKGHDSEISGKTHWCPVGYVTRDVVEVA